MMIFYSSTSGTAIKLNSYAIRTQKSNLTNKNMHWPLSD